MTMITPSYLGETIEYSSLHACRSTLEDPTLLCDAIAREAGVPVPSTKTVAILWGAGHMPAVVHYLMGPLRYRVLTTEWVTVFVP